MTRDRLGPVPLAVAVLALVAVVWFGLAVATTASFTRADLSVDQWLSARHEAPLVALAHGIDWFFGPTVGVFVALAAAIAVAVVTRRARAVVTFVVVVGAGWGSNQLVKAVVDRARPDPAALADPFVPQPASFSYPSGHTAIVTVLVIAAVAVASGRARRVLLVAGPFLVALVAWSRVYLGVHYPSDVVAAVVWCSAASILLLALVRRVGDSWPRLRAQEEQSSPSAVER